MQLRTCTMANNGGNEQSHQVIRNIKGNVKEREKNATAHSHTSTQSREQNKCQPRKYHNLSGVQQQSKCAHTKVNPHRHTKEKQNRRNEIESSAGWIMNPGNDTATKTLNWQLHVWPTEGTRRELSCGAKTSRLATDHNGLRIAGNTQLTELRCRNATLGCLTNRSGCHLIEAQTNANE